ncbi:MAG: alpha/beta hydrolase [Chloroflexota bacterium]
MGKFLRRVLLVGMLVLVLAYIGISWVVASLVIEYRDVIDRDDLEWQAIYAPEWDVPVTETVEIMNGERVLVADIYDNPAEGDCGVITLHGLGGDRALVRQYGPLFYQMGCDVISYDFAPRNNDVFLTYGYDEKDDLSVVLAWFAHYTGLPTEQIGLFGTSYGAATVLQALPENDSIAWAIADSSYASLSQVLSDQINMVAPPLQITIPLISFIIEERTGTAVEDVSPMDSITLTDVPILVIHSRTDELIPFNNTQIIYDNAKPETTRLILTDWGSLHVQSYYDDKIAYGTLVLDFLAEFAPNFGNQSDVALQDL